MTSTTSAGGPSTPRCENCDVAAHHEDVRFCHVVLAENHVKRREKDLAKAVSFEIPANLKERHLGGVLMRQALRRIHIQDACQELVMLPVVGQRRKVVVCELSPATHHETMPSSVGKINP